MGCPGNGDVWSGGGRVGVGVGGEGGRGGAGPASYTPYRKMGAFWNAKVTVLFSWVGL